MKEVGSRQLVIGVPAFQAGLRFTCLPTCQTGALECGPGTPALLVCQRLQQGHPRGQNALGGRDGGSMDYPYPQR